MSLLPRPHIEPLVDRDVPWKRLRLGKLPTGIQYRTLSMDPQAGSCTLAVRYEEGFRMPPGLSRSTVEIFVLKGALQVGERECGPGFYFYVPAGVGLPEIGSRKGCEALLMYNDSAPHFEDSDRHASPEAAAGLIQVNSYDDLLWKESTIYPVVEPGCLIKTLRFDLATGAMTFLYDMVPFWWQDNVSFHDCMEEGYHIWGTSWMLQFGELPTGGYFWRPPYINHGPFASAHGCLGFGRVDSFLYNHFHWNVWSTPEENREGARNRLWNEKPTLMEWMRVNGCVAPEAAS
jgi:Domain of unknown function (DUF4437)